MKGRTPPPRQLPGDADERRIAAALKACEHISTEALEAGLMYGIWGTGISACEP